LAATIYLSLYAQSYAATIDKQNTESPVNILSMTCESEGESVKISRFSVIDVNHLTGSKKIDYGLITGHGLPFKQPCYVQDFNGRKRSVINIWYAPNYMSGGDNDWAVVSFKRLSTPNLTRYKLQSATNIVPETFNKQNIKFAAARGLPYTTQDCQLSELKFSLSQKQAERRIVTHDCQSIPGQSGSPVIFDDGTTEHLIGFHIGQIWLFKDPETQRPNRRGYFRLIDQSLVSDVETIIQNDK
jgi:hypothetical protein